MIMRSICPQCLKNVVTLDVIPMTEFLTSIDTTCKHIDHSPDNVAALRSGLNVLDCQKMSNCPKVTSPKKRDKP